METTTFIQTKAALLKKSEREFQEVTFESYKRKGVSKSSQVEENDDLKGKSNEFNLKKAKYEVVKLGISGFDPLKKEEAKVQLAIKLGAKPPKNKYKNYKLLLEEKKRNKEKGEKLKDFQQLGKNTSGQSLAKGKSFDRNRKKKEGLLNKYGKVNVQL